MSTSIESCHDLDLAEAESRESVYSPASSYSTYSHEVKYIFNPVEDNTDEYGDYSHIAPRSKQNYMSHTPRTISASSQLSGKENRTPHLSGEDSVFIDSAQHVMSSRTNSVMSGTSRDRGPISPHLEEALYAHTHYGYGHRKQNGPSEIVAKDRTYFSPTSDGPHYPYARHAYPMWKNKNNNTVNLGPHPHAMPKASNLNQDAYPHARNSVAVPPLNSFHTQVPLSNTHSYHHYQQPHVHNHHHPPASDHPHYNQPLPGYIHTGQEPPYPMPPRYHHQHHTRRKTWSPPALKMSLINAGSQGSRVCHSNDSLDVTQEAGIERKSQSLSEDLDVTPPKLAPISGVLAQKPGPNLIKPIAFKPIHASPARSPVNQTTRRHQGGEDHGSGSHDTIRAHGGMKLGTSMLGIQGSPETQRSRSMAGGAFNSMAKPQPYVPYPNHPGHAGDHTYPHQGPHSQPPSVHSSHSSSLHNSSNSSHNQNISSYINLPAHSQHNLSANSSHLSAGDDASFSNEFPRPSDRPDSIPSLNVSRVSSHAVEGVLQTPSPSDSGVGELEAMLREKDAEINTLREVMDRNERAIFQVYEEKRNVWLHDTQELRDDYERKLKIQSRKSYKTEQVLSLQVYKLQQEQKTLQEEKVKIASEKDVLKQELEECQNQVAQLKARLEDSSSGEDGQSGESVPISTSEDKLDEAGKTDGNSRSPSTVQEELAIKNKELITLKSQLHSFQTDMEKKNKEVAEKVRELSAKSDQIKSLKDELQRLRDPPVLTEAGSQTHVPSEVAASENLKPSMLGERDKTITSLQDELLQIRAEVALLKEEHEREREQWLDEKNKVVRYQKQLQLNYVQMQRKNATLESEVQQLTLELENRDMKLIALSGEESVC